MNWSLLRNTNDPSAIVEWAIVLASSWRCWSWVHIPRVKAALREILVGPARVDDDPPPAPWGACHWQARWGRTTADLELGHSLEPSCRRG